MRHLAWITLLAVAASASGQSSREAALREQAESLQQRAEELAEQAAEKAREGSEIARKHAAELREQLERLREDERVWVFARPSGRTEKAAFLGVATVPVTPALQEQLGLQRGVGLVVDTIEPDSPAVAAGLQRYDILQKLDDQWLINAHQFSVLVRLRQAGSSVTLTVLRKGQPMTVQATLVEKELPVLDASAPWGASRFEVAPLGPLGPRGSLRVVPEAPPVLLRPGEGDASERTVNIAFEDRDMKLSVTRREGKRHVRAEGPDGKVLFDGPANTPQEMEALPESVRARLEALDAHVGQLAIETSTDQPRINVRIIRP